MVAPSYQDLKMALGVLIAVVGFYGIFCTSVALANWRMPGMFKWLMLGISVMYFAALIISIYFFEVA